MKARSQAQLHAEDKRIHNQVRQYKWDFIRLKKHELEGVIARRKEMRRFLQMWCVLKTLDFYVRK